MVERSNKLEGTLPPRLGIYPSADVLVPHRNDIFLKDANVVEKN